MNSKLHFINLLTLAVLCMSCSKPNTPPIQINHIYKSKFLIKAIRWPKINTQADLTYNADSTLNQMSYSNPGNIKVNFSYNNQKIKEYRQAGSIYKTSFTYNSAGQMATMSREVMDAPGQSRTTLKLDFSYTNDDRLSSIKHFLVNATGNKLMHTVSYEYDNQLRPVKITSVEESGIRTIVTIEAYSDQVSFDPLYFIDTGGLTIINADYMIYNYPVLSRLKELPSLIKVTRIENGKSTLEQETKITYTINNQRLEKQTNELSFPLTPQINYITQMEYDY